MTEVVRGMAALDRRLDAIGSPTMGRGMMTKLTLRGVREAKLIVHKRSKNLMHSIHPGEITASTGQMIASAAYAGDVEFGTRAHVITPRVARVLAWGGARRLTGALRTGAKATNFAMIVHHPGTVAYPYMVPGARRALEQEHLLNEVVLAWNQAA